MGRGKMDEGTAAVRVFDWGLDHDFCSDFLLPTPPPLKSRPRSGICGQSKTEGNRIFFY